MRGRMHQRLIAGWGAALTAAALLLALCDDTPAAAATAPTGSIVIRAPGTSAALALNVSGDCTEYDVLVDGSVWLRGGGPAFHLNSRWWEAGAGLTLHSKETETGIDPQLGRFSALSAEWSAGGVRVVTIWRVHPSAITFTQEFPDGANGTAIPQLPAWKPGDIAVTDDINQLVTAFPRFQTGNFSGRLSELGYFSFRYFWDLEMTGGNGGGLGGDFNRDGAAYGGVPLLLHDRDTLRSIVLSPIENFKVAFTAQTKQPPLGDDLACGIHGRVRSIPPGFNHTTILFSDASQRRGVRLALLGWGDVLLARNRKPRTPPSPSIQQTHLGYGTATGAYYWYRTESGASYEETMRAIQSSHISHGLSVGWYEIDSWFYFKAGNSTGEDGGCREWKARPDIFPHGLPAVHKALGPLMTHCKYFSADNIYQRQFHFLKDPESGLPDNDTHAIAIPTDQAFWDLLLTTAMASGVSLWKQDWLASLFELSHRAGEDVTTAVTFHRQLANAAASRGIELQFCMPTPSDIMQTVESPTARYARLSDDYCTNPLQWKIGRVSLVAEALGIGAFKDAFWTVEEQPGYRVQKDECWVPEFTEPNPMLQAAVSSLSNAQVAFGDRIGHTNHSLLLWTCLADGTLLRPDRPAVAIDATFHRNGTPGEVWATAATVSGLMFHYVLSANLSVPYTIPTSEMGLNLTTSHLAFDVVARAVDSAQSLSWCCVAVDSANALTLPASPAIGVITPFHLHAAMPLVHGFALLGEPNKFLPVAPQRFERLQVSASSLEVMVKRSGGTHVESVHIAVRLPLEHVVEVKCNFEAGRTGPALLACTTARCSCNV